MAEFNPETGVEPNTNWLNASQGYSANKTIGNLFKGFADAADSGLKAYDQTKRTNIALDASRQVEALATTKPTEPVAIPPGLKMTLEKVDKYRNAVQQGAMSDIEFKIRLDKTAKEMRSKYGEGYRDVIDNSLANAQGVSTANQVRDELLQQIKAEATAGDKELARNLSFLNQNEEIIGGGNFQAAYETYTGKKFNPADFNYYAAYSISAGIKAKKYDLEYKTAALNYVDKEQTVNENVAQKVAAEDVSARITSLFNDKASPEWLRYKQTLTASTDPKGPGGASLTPEEQTQLRTMWNTVNFQAQLMVDQVLAQDYSTTITSKAARDNIKDIVASRLGIYQKTLDDQQFGLFNAVALENAAKGAQAESDITNDPLLGEFTSRLSALQKMGWPLDSLNNAINTMQFDINGKKVEGAEVRRKLLQNSLFGSLMGSENAASDILFAAEAAGLSPADNMQALEQKVKTVLDPTVSKELAASGMSNIYAQVGDDFVEKFATDDPSRMIQLLASHEMTDKMYGTKMYSSYLQWLSEQFRGVAIPAANTLISAQQTTDDTLVNFDGKRFSVEETNFGLSKHSAAGKLIEQNRFAQAKRQVDIMNTYIDAVEYAFKKGGASDQQITQHILSFFGGQSVQEFDKQGSWYTLMKKAIIKNIEESSAEANSQRVTGGKNPKTQ